LDSLRTPTTVGNTAAGDDIGLVAIGSKIFQDLLHRFIGEFGLRAFPAGVLGACQPLLCLGVSGHRVDVSDPGLQEELNDFISNLENPAGANGHDFHRDLSGSKATGAPCQCHWSFPFF
jgi:hypothetical protein